MSGSPVAYWASAAIRAAFRDYKPLRESFDPIQGTATADDGRFLRGWYEVSVQKTCLEGRFDGLKWFPFTKGGEKRKWYGNNNLLVNWEGDGREIKQFERAFVRNEDYYYKEHLTWSLIGGSAPSFRMGGSGFIFGHKGPAILKRDGIYSIYELASFLNSNVAASIFEVTSPSFSVEIGHIASVPLSDLQLGKSADNLVSIARADWDAYETSWDFTTLPLLASEYRRATLAETYGQLRAHWQGMTDEMRALEEENNRIFIQAYGLADELTPEVPLSEITLTCNPAYRYGGNRSAEELEALLLADTMRELVSYAVGCMFGRYSLDAPGLVIASQGEGLDVYAARVPDPSFAPDADNVIPALDGEWFADDIAQRLRRFLRTAFGDAHFADNLAFVEAALGKDIRKYFTRDFYNDHVKRFRKRPVYWLFSSPKGSFNALIYLHRYRADTVSVVLNDYLREFRAKLETHRATQASLSINADETPASKAKALKEIDLATRQIAELDDWERDILFPLASQRLEIDLDDGVKANYPKFGAALKPIKGLEEAEA